MLLQPSGMRTFWRAGAKIQRVETEEGTLACVLSSQEGSWSCFNQPRGQFSVFCQPRGHLHFGALCWPPCFYSSLWRTNQTLVPQFSHLERPPCGVTGGVFSWLWSESQVHTTRCWDWIVVCWAPLIYHYPEYPSLYGRVKTSVWIFSGG